MGSTAGVYHNTNIVDSDKDSDNIRIIGSYPVINIMEKLLHGKTINTFVFCGKMPVSIMHQVGEQLHISISQRIPGKKLWVSLLLFLFLILLFTLGTSSLSENTVRRQKESLTQALNRDITYCYATTGRYPETLEAIKKDYGLIYDDSLFFVDYRTQGSNIYPEVTIIERGR